MRNRQITIFLLSILLAGIWTISSCNKENSIKQAIETKTTKNDIGVQGRQTSPFLTIRCGVKTSPVPPLPNFYAGIGGDFGGIRTSSITKLQVTCRYISSASGTDQTFTQNVGFTVTSNTSGSYGAAFSLPNYVIGSDRVEVSSIIFGKNNVVLASSGTILCKECCPY